MESNVASCGLFTRTSLMAVIVLLYIATQGAAGAPGTYWHREARATVGYDRHLIPCGRYICNTKSQYCTEVISGLPECFMCADQCHKSRVGNNNLYISNCMELCPEYWRRMTREKHITETTELPAPRDAAAQTAHSGAVVFSGTLLTALAVFLTAVFTMLLVILIVTRRRRSSKIRQNMTSHQNRIVMRHPNISEKTMRTPSVLTNPLVMEDEFTTAPVYNTRITLSDTGTSATDLAGSTRGISQSIIRAQTRKSQETSTTDLANAPPADGAHSSPAGGAPSSPAGGAASSPAGGAHSQSYTIDLDVRDSGSPGTTAVRSGLVTDTRMSSGSCIRTQAGQSGTARRDTPHPGAQESADPAANIPQGDLYRNNLQSGTVGAPRAETNRCLTWPRTERT